MAFRTFDLVCTNLIYCTTCSLKLVIFSFWSALFFYGLYTMLVLGLQASACLVLICHNRDIGILRSLWGNANTRITNFVLILIISCLELFSLRTSTAFAITKNFEVDDGILGAEFESEKTTTTLSLITKLFYTGVKRRVYDFDQFGKVQPFFTEDGRSHLLLFCMVNKNMRGTIKYRHFLSSGVCILLLAFLLW